MTITEKDKKLLVIAGIFLVAVALILFVIQPGFTGFSENNAKIEPLKAQKETMKTEIEALPTYEANLKSAVDAYNTAAARIYGDLSADKIQDTVMSEYVNKYSVSISNLTISGTTSYAVARFANTTNENGDVIGAGGATNSDTGAIRLATITANISGTAANVIAVIDALNASDGVYVQQVSYSNVAEGTTANITFLMALSETFA